MIFLQILEQCFNDVITELTLVSGPARKADTRVQPRIFLARSTIVTSDGRTTGQL